MIVILMFQAYYIFCFSLGRMMKNQTYLTNALGRRVAEEAQLLAEEKWIIESLAKIRNQKNSLQIERLHLESLKAQLNVDERAKGTQPISEVQEYMEPMTSTVNIMKTSSAGLQNIEFVSAFDCMDTEATCNDEELNLSVTNSVFEKNIDPLSFNMEEEDEDDEDEDRDDESNLLIDINMLMNAGDMDK